MTMVKVFFRLIVDEDGYPPASAESVWADALEDGTCRLENVPFFAEGVAFGDVVQVGEAEGVLWFERVVAQSGHGTMRVVVHDPADMDPVRTELLAAGAELERLGSLLAVDVPSADAWERVHRALAAWSRDERLEVEESKFPLP